MAVSLQALALAIWFGGGLATLYGTRAVFAVAPSRREAGRYTGAMLASFRWLQIAALLFFLASLFGAVAGPARLCGTLAGLFTALSFPLDARLRRLRDEMGGSTEGIGEADPRRRQFGMLHGFSVLLLIGQVLCSGIGLVGSRTLQ